MVFFVDHLALRYMTNKPNLTSRVAQWILLLVELDYTVEYKPNRLHTWADHLYQLSDTLGTIDIDNELLNAELFTITRLLMWDTYISKFFEHSKTPGALRCQRTAQDLS